MNTEEEWISKAPKVELHVHLDGAFDSSLLWERAKEISTEELPLEVETPWSGARLPVRKIITDSLGSLQEFEAAVSTTGRIGGLGQVLDCFETFFPLVKGNRDLLGRLVLSFCESQKKQNIIYTEVRYAPHLICKEGTMLPDARSVVSAVTEVLGNWAKTNPGFLVNQILCCVNLQSELSDAVCALAVEHQGDMGGVVGVDIACGEHHFSAEQAEAFERHRTALATAKKAGLGITVHAGESGSGQNVVRALETYGADRIGHGYNIVHDAAALARCREEGERRPHLELCPTSAIACESVPHPEEGDGAAGWDRHVLAQMVRDDALSVSVSSDDPSVFSCTLASDLSLLARALALPPA
eukprot:CAMPEP_0181323870 /NCGR_PEP_ID=MMETSP1101-20121128/20035_1 /TAXON_ID=46948 /ORGANISM="Rhodomonas abbreviata, Strain Caron Lab Isolate" /LENGTH=355 /DNA_ID=CAMNT_0023431965 /DNA_START=79 /DNA_END=1142 /DNA_ORIENTATION=-